MRKLSLVLLVLVLLMMGSVVSAQDLPCGDLSEEDCSILAGSAAAMASVDSATFTIEATISATDEDDETTEITITGDGAFSGVEGMLAGMMSGMMTNPASAADMASMMGDVTAAFGEFSGALNLSIDADGQELEIQLVLVDSIGYVNFGALGLAGMQLGQDAELPEWGGVNLVELAGTLMEGMPPDAMDDMIDDMAGGVTGGAEIPEGFDPETIGNYMTITRLEDAEIDGVAVAVFETSLDFAGLMSDPAMMEMIQQQMEESDEEIDMTPEEMVEMMNAMYENMSFAVTSYIGLEDNFIYGIEFTASIDATAMMEAAPESADVEGEGGAFDINFGLYFADHNADPEITAPEGAVVAEAEELMQMFGMMFMGASRGS